MDSLLTYLFLIEAMGYFESWINSMFVLICVWTMHVCIHVVLCLDLCIDNACMHSCCSWIDNHTVLNLNLHRRWCNALKKFQRVPLGGGMLEQHPGAQKALSGFFLFLCNRVYKRVKSVKLASTYADSLSKTRVYLQVTWPKRVYWLVYPCDWLFLYTHSYTHVFGCDYTRASIRARHFFSQVILCGQEYGYEPDPL